MTRKQVINETERCSKKNIEFTFSTINNKWAKWEREQYVYLRRGNKEGEQIRKYFNQLV